MVKPTKWQNLLLCLKHWHTGAVGASNAAFIVTGWILEDAGSLHGILLQAQSLAAVVKPLCNRNRMKGMILISLLLHHWIFFMTFRQAYLNVYFNSFLYCCFLFPDLLKIHSGLSPWWQTETQFGFHACTAGVSLYSWHVCENRTLFLNITLVCQKPLCNEQKAWLKSSFFCFCNTSLFPRQAVWWSKSFILIPVSQLILFFICL